MTENALVALIEKNSGKLYIVGGWVRDMLMKRKPKDKDYVLCGMEENTFCRLFPKAKKVGRNFPVYLLEIDGKKCEVAFARTEKKQGRGYKGFTAHYDKNVTIEEDLFRRDTCMNSIAMRLPDKEIIDPYNGRLDIEDKIICATSEHFREDPVRALRAARQAAELNFSVDDNTLHQMTYCAEELKCEPSERIFNELERALKADRPSIFFYCLKEAKLLEIIFPEIAALIGQTQPALFHPEGDSFIHTMMIVDDVAAETSDTAARFAGLCHDLGKGLTPKVMLPHHYGHERTGLTALKKWNERMTLPTLWYKGAEFVIAEHMRAAHLAHPGKIVDLLLAIEKNSLGIDNFCIVIKADSKILPFYLTEIHEILPILHSVDMKNCPECFQGKRIGQWLREQRIGLLQKYIRN